MKRLVLFLIALFLLSSPIAIKADENDDLLTLNFRDFSYSTDMISSSSRIEYENNGRIEKYIVYDLDTGEATDAFYVKYLENNINRNDPYYTVFLTHDKYIGSAATIRFTACVTMYYEGSFRSIQALQYTNLSVVDSVCEIYLENMSTSAWSHSGSFPCTRLDYAYTGNAVSDVSYDAGVSYGLVEAGFSFSYHYYRYLNHSGSFNIYQ